MDVNLSSVVGYHDVNNVKARELLQPYLGTDGYFLLRPSSDRKGGVLCTICVTNKSRIVNYRLTRDPATRNFFIHQTQMFPDIQRLLKYYMTSAINAEANTRLLHPVTPTTTPSHDDGEDAYVVMERRDEETNSTNTTPSNKHETETNFPGGKDIPGLHQYLPKSEIKTVMGNYLGEDGWYLIRPSSTSEGQLTLAVSHQGKTLNFKINSSEGGTQFYIAPKNKHPSVQALLLFYKKSPIRSKKYGSQKIFLLNPIPVDRSAEDKMKKKLEQKVAMLSLPPPLPEPWVEHYDVEYKRMYYYNPKTQESKWDRPRPLPTSTELPQLPAKSPKRKMQGRALPAIPGEKTTEVPSSPGLQRRLTDITESNSRPPRRARGAQPLPPLPDKEQKGEVSGGCGEPRSGGRSPRQHQRRKSDHLQLSNKIEKDLPSVPPPATRNERVPPSTPLTKENVTAKKEKTIPALPPKNDTMLNSTERRSSVPLPEKDQQSGQTDRFKDSPPSLPPKDEPPQLPQKETNYRPPLPPKEDAPPVTMDAEKPLPPLPPKSIEVTRPAEAALGVSPAQERKAKRKNIIEYEDVPLKSSPVVKKNEGPPPPLPNKEVTHPPPIMNGAPPPPPPPPVGAPTPPPPPPPTSPPSPLPPLKAERSQSLEDSSGRPFSAGDLAHAKTLLKKRAETAPRNLPATSGLGGVFANAIDSRMSSIRRAMVDSDSEESEFEDVDDDDWD